MDGLKSLSENIRRIYDTDSEDVPEIFNLLLGKTRRYSRIGSYFTSKSFIPLAEGLSEFILKSGKMRLIINYELEQEDFEEVKKSINYKKIEDKIILDMTNIRSEIELNSAKVLGWLISEKRLEIRVVIGEKNKLMHIKEGVFEDDFGNKVAFTGSINETYSGYEKNIEQITFFKNWEKGQEEYVEELLRKFNHFWGNNGSDARTYSLSKAIEGGLIRIRPKSDSELKKAIETISRHHLGNIQKKFSPYPYQEEAVNLWIQNGKKGIIEMPTGCGKTKTAFFCYKQIEKMGPTLTIIFSPTKTICNQWIDEFKEEACKVCKIYDNPKWKYLLKKEIIDLRLKTNEQLVVVGTYALMNSPYLVNQIRSLENTSKFLIADEVHSAGADKTSEGLIEDYDYRLGLSATPKRWLDEEGTNQIFEYFKGVVFDKISLYDAIYKLNVLCEYKYHLIHVILNDEELAKYLSLQRKMGQKLSEKKKDPFNKSLDVEIQRISEKMANVIKNCHSKIDEFSKIIDKITEERSIIFVSPEQRKEVLEIIGEKVRYHQFTYSETKPELRTEILENFKKGVIKCIVAIRCLNEGLDVPCAKIGVLMSSSGNPREFIQRRGRLLRKNKNDPLKEAEIYDFFVTPPKEIICSSETFKNQISKELSRIDEFCKSAKNELELAKDLKALKKELGI